MRLKTGALVASSAALALVLSACGGGGGTSSTTSSGPKGASGFDAGSKGVVNPSDKKGGTLKMANSDDIDSYDPARTYYAWGWNFTKSYYVRTLVTNSPKPGKDGTVLVPDLAQDMPQISDDKLTYTFKLKEPFADFPYLLAMPGAGPVPKAKDTGERYANKPVSSGPYKFQSLEVGKKVVLVRNENWDPATDPNRKALPDEIDMTLKLDSNEIDNQLLDGSLDIDTAQVGVQQAAQAKILLNPDLKKNADNPITGFTRYFAIGTKVPPFDNIHCRIAVQYAADKVALQTSRGGANAGGDIATSLLPPNILGHDDSIDPFNTKSGKPQVDKAKQELQQCGHPDGFTTSIATTNTGKGPKTAEALQQALAQVGIKATIAPSDASAYYRTTIGSPSNVKAKGYGLMVAGWGADFPTPYGFDQVLVDGRAIKPSGNNNYAELNDPEINSLIDQAKAEPDVQKSAAIWTQIDKKVADQAVYLPFVYDKALNYRNPKMTNVFVNGYYGMWDFSALGVS